MNIALEEFNWGKALSNIFNSEKIVLYKIFAYVGKEDLHVTTLNSFVEGPFMAARKFISFMYLFIVGP